SAMINESPLLSSNPSTNSMTNINTNVNTAATNITSSSSSSSSSSPSSSSSLFTLSSSSILQDTGKKTLSDNTIKNFDDGSDHDTKLIDILSISNPSSEHDNVKKTNTIKIF